MTLPEHNKVCVVVPSGTLSDPSDGASPKNDKIVFTASCNVFKLLRAYVSSNCTQSIKKCQPSFIISYKELYIYVISILKIDIHVIHKYRIGRKIGKFILVFTD